MTQIAIVRTIMTIAAMTSLPLALGMPFAEARGVGVGQKPRPEQPAPQGRAAEPGQPQATPLLLQDEILAERSHAKVPASEAGGLLDDLRLQLAKEPQAVLSIRWRLTRPAEAK